MLEFYGSLAKFEELRSHASGNFEFLVLILVTSSLAHLPPMKVVSIASGALSVNIWLFIASCIVARGARFRAHGLAAAALRRADPRVHREAAGSARRGRGCALLIALYFAVRYLRALTSFLPRAWAHVAFALSHDRRAAIPFHPRVRIVSRAARWRARARSGARRIRRRPIRRRSSPLRRMRRPRRRAVAGSCRRRRRRSARSASSSISRSPVSAPA